MKWIGKAALTLATFAGMHSALLAGVGEIETTEPHTVLETGVVDEPVRGAIFAGGAAREDSFYSYAGAVHSLNGDLNESGFTLKAFVGGGQYYYDTVAVPDGEETGSILDFSATLGYQYVVKDNWKLSLGVGPHLKDKFLDDGDPGNVGSSGTSVGVKVEGGISGAMGPVDLSALAQYTSVENSVWTRGRAGYNTGFYTMKLGPEITFLNNDTFEELRVGGFVGFQPTRDFGFTLSLGYADFDSDSASSGSSIYGGAGIVWTY
ncbi:MAG: cellulose biosynthesis protein BcsS [Verrucomicrobiota bacterium]